MKKNIFFISLIILLFIIIIISTIIGPVKISLYQLVHMFKDLIFMQNSSEANIYSNIQYSVLFNIRIPRIILGCLVGMALGVSGAILQSLFRNPLVDPGFIGVSSGAAIGAMLVIMFSNLIKNFVLDIFLPYLLPIFAMIGAMTTTLLVYKISKSAHKTNVMVMLLAGIAINSLVGSIIGLLIISSNDLQLRAFTFWTLGGLDGANWQVIFIASTFILIPLVFIYFLRTKLDIFMLGDSEANNLGLNVEKFKKIIIFLSALMVGVSVSFCGMIGFIGLVTPHLIRLFIGPKHNNLLIGSSLLGALLLVFSDFIAKIIIAPAQLPISIITSLIGAPFFIWLIIEQKKRMKIA